MKHLKNNRHTFQLIGGLLAISIIAALAGHVFASGAASLSLSPSSGSHAINTSFTIKVYENSGAEAVDTVVADVTYDASKLQVTAADNTGSGFGLCNGPVLTAGKVSLGCTSTGTNSVTGNQLVGSITFKALAGSGSTAVSFASSSYIARYSDGSNAWNNGTTGGSYSLTTPATPPPPPPSPTPTPTPTPSPSPSGGSTGSSSSGSTAKAGASTTGSPATTPNVAAQRADPAAPVTVGDPRLEGPSSYLVAIKVEDKSGKLLVGAHVTLGDQSATSDSQGIASFTSVPPGKYNVTVKTTDGSVTQPITVSSDKQPTDIQSFNVSLKRQSNTGSTPIVIIPAAAVLLLLVGGTVLIRRKMHSQFSATDQYTAVVMPKKSSKAVVSPLPTTSVEPAAPDTHTATLEELDKHYRKP